MKNTLIKHNLTKPSEKILQDISPDFLIFKGLRLNKGIAI